MDITLTIAIVSFITAVILAYINYRLNRQNDRFSKKSEMRTQAYIDFINCVSELAVLARKGHTRNTDVLIKLTDSKSRIAIYGNVTVIQELANFDQNFGIIDSELASDAFMKIVHEMRNDAVGKSKKASIEDLKQIILGNKS